MSRKSALARQMSRVNTYAEHAGPLPAAREKMIGGSEKRMKGWDGSTGLSVVIRTSAGRLRRAWYRKPRYRAEQNQLCARKKEARCSAPFPVTAPVALAVKLQAPSLLPFFFLALLFPAPCIPRGNQRPFPLEYLGWSRERAP